MQRRHLSELPDELWLSHIFEYLLGPIGKYTTTECSSLKIEELNQIGSMKLFKFDLECLRGINSMSCVCSNLRKRLFYSEFNIDHDDEEIVVGKLTVIETFWLNVSNLVELTNYFIRFEEYSSMTLTSGDLNHTEAMEMSKIQMTIENIEMGTQSSAALLAGNCSRADIYDTLIELEKRTEMPKIHADFEERMNQMITSPSKYLKIKQKTGISVYELFVYKAHVMSLGMVPNFDSEQKIQDSWGDEIEHTLLSLELSSKNLGEGRLGLILQEFDPKDMEICSKYLSITAVTLWTTINSVSFSNTLQYLSLVVQVNEYNELGDMLKDCYFPNVKLLSLSLGDEEGNFTMVLSYDPERYKMVEKTLLQSIKKSTFPKLIHLSLKKFFDYEAISQIEVLDQLICLEIISGYWTYKEQPSKIWQEEQVKKMLDKTYFNDSFENCMQLLIIYNTIHSRWIDGDLGTMKEYYRKCRERRFAGSISHSSVLEYYSICYE